MRLGRRFREEERETEVNVTRILEILVGSYAKEESGTRKERVAKV